MTHLEIEPEAEAKKKDDEEEEEVDPEENKEEVKKYKLTIPNIQEYYLKMKPD